jgi:hypothetical protein
VAGRAGAGGTSSVGGVAGTAGGTASGAGGAADACGAAPAKPASACQDRCYGGHHYYFCDVKLDRAAASAACSNVQMKLVHIETEAENAFIDETVKTEACCSISLAPDYHWAGLWIGARDAQMQADWRWDDDQTPFWKGLAAGAAVGGAFASWDVDQPNNGNLGPDEYCVRTTGSLWNDTPCELDPLAASPFDGIGYICEQ